MKKNSKILFISTLIAVILLYVVSAIFTLGTVFTPATALASSTNPQRDKTNLNSFVNVDVLRNKPDPENEGKLIGADINKIYVYIGEVRSYATDENGVPYVEIRFQFKTKSSNDGSRYYREEVAKIPVRELSGGYEWVKVFDASEENRGEIAYSRVKICTPDSLDLYEVVFTDATGYVLATEAVFGTPEQIAEAKLVIDEQNMFKLNQSKKYHFTDAELKNLASANALRGGRVAVGEGPFTSIVHLVGISVFGTNTFGLRFFDCMAGLGMILIAYAFAVKTFGHSKYGLTVLLSVLALGAVFTSANFALGGIGAFFACLSVYLATRYFVKHYYLDDIASGIACMLGIGLCYGIAVACDMAYSLVLVGHVVLFAMARRRAYKQFKRNEKEARGLEKEDVFLTYRKNRWISVGVFAISLLIIPVALFTVSFAVCSKVYKGFYGVGFVQSALKYFVASITPSYQSFPLALYAGFGGIKVGAYYSFLNYFTSIFALVCFALVTVVVFFGKKIPFFNNVSTIKNKYKLTTVAFLTLSLPVFLGLTSSPYGFASVSVFMCAYIAFAQSILVKCAKRNVVNLAFNVATCISIVLFGLAYVGLVGIATSEVASKILYLWQVL